MLGRVVLLTLLLWVVAARKVTISNLEPKTSTTHEIVNAHDGTYQWIDGWYWYHGAEYGLCKEPPRLGCDQTPGPVGPPYPAPGRCGFQADHNVSIWRSRDLSAGSWEFVGRAAHCATDIPGCSILYRPHLVHNPNTKLYVLFVNYVTNGGGYGGNAVFTASSPAGPFSLANPQMNLTRLCPGPAVPEGAKCGPAQGGCGDFDVAVDPEDGAAYIIYGCNFWMGIEKLSPDYLYTEGTNGTVVGGGFEGSTFPEYFVEAPAFFHRNGSWYALFGHCCCFCEQGSGVMAYTAPHLLGPWRPQCSDLHNNSQSCLSATGDLACVPSSVGSPFTGTPTPGQGCAYQGRSDSSSVRAQQNYVISVRAADGSDQLIWTGDRWQQSPDGLKGHEGQTWAVLEFDGVGRILPIRWQDTISFDVAPQ